MSSRHELHGLGLGRVGRVLAPGRRAEQVVEAVGPLVARLVVVAVEGDVELALAPVVEDAAVRQEQRAGAVAVALLRRARVRAVHELDLVAAVRLEEQRAVVLRRRRAVPDRRAAELAA